MTDQAHHKQEQLRAKAQELRQAASQKMGDLWWTFAIRGALALLLGILALIWPQESLTLLLRIAGIFLFFDGAVTLLHQTKSENAGPDAGSGLFAAIIGGLLALLPSASSKMAFTLIGVWALSVGANYLMDWWKAPKGAPERGPILTAGLMTVLAGLALVLWPGIGQSLSGWVLALAAFVASAAMFFLAAKFRQLRSKIAPGG